MVLQDGTILDPTADQFGEGHDVRVLDPGDPEYGRYRPEFHVDWHPGHPDAGDRLDGWLFLHPDGAEDHDLQDALNRERGRAWHLGDPTAYLAYLDEQVALATGGWDCGEMYSRWADEIRAAHPAAAGPAPRP